MTTRMQKKIQELIDDALLEGASPKDVVQYMAECWENGVLDLLNTHKNEWEGILK